MSFTLTVQTSSSVGAVSYTHLDVYKRQIQGGREVWEDPVSDGWMTSIETGTGY